jgi:hypothetical protein
MAHDRRRAIADIQKEELTNIIGAADGYAQA